MASVLFKNANLLDPLQAELLEGQHVLVEDGVIKEVSDRPITAASARVIDAAGRTLMPGLIDLHVHVLATQLNLSTQGVLPDALVMMRAVPIMAAMLRRFASAIPHHRDMAARTARPGNPGVPHERDDQLARHAGQGRASGNPLPGSIDDGR